jgi:hypothetical protein
MRAQYLYYPYSLLSCVGLRLRPRYLCVHNIFTIRIAYYHVLGLGLGHVIYACTPMREAERAPFLTILLVVNQA